MRLLLTLLLLASSLPSHAGISGTVRALNTSGARAEGTFTCEGQPVCTGTYTISIRPTNCANALPTFTDALRLEGLDLARTGTFPVNATFTRIDIDNIHVPPDNRCVEGPRARGDLVVSFSVGWSGSQGTLSATFTNADGQVTMTGDFSADAPAAAPTTRLHGQARAEGSPGHIQEVTFDCSGEPVCTGTYFAKFTETDCAGATTSAAFSMTGVDLARPGPIAGVLTFRRYDWTPLSGCSPPPGATFIDAVHPYTGTWDGRAGTLAFDRQESPTLFRFTGTFSANREAPPPVFDLEVTARIDAARATATAQVQFRPEDVGTTKSGFVFAYAPRARVTGLSGESPKAGDDCAIAQLTPGGQLVAATVSQLQAFFAGTISAQTAAVTILDNVATPAVAGATFYVGYGADAATMFDEAFFRDAVLVPGNEVCPLLPFATSLWWNPRESGWGLNLNQQGRKLFGTLFTYDAQRAPMWLVMSDGALQPDGRSFAGDLYRTTGPAFNAQPFTPIGPANVTQVGRLTVSFSDANLAALSYSVDGAQVAKSIQRQVFGTRAANCMPAAESRASSQHYQDLWWNPAESGWGVNVTQQDSTLFATLFTYEASGRGLWLVMSDGRRQADGSYQGDLFRTSGPAFNAVPFTPVGAGDVTSVGSMRLRFADGENGQLTYTYNGAPVTKQITRQLFSGPPSACR